MSFLLETQSEGEFAPFRALQADLGFVPNLFLAQSLLPRVIEAHASLEKAVNGGEGAISRIHKRRILLSVAAARRDAYCAALDANALLAFGVSESHIAALLKDYRSAGLSEGDIVLLGFCLKLTGHPLSVSSDDIDDLRAHGFGDESIIEAVVAAALAVYRCTLSVGLGPEPDFDQRELSFQASPAAREADPERSPHGIHRAKRKQGPYVRAPYVNPKTFPPFATLHKSHGFIPNFFRSQTLRPDLLEAQTDAVSKILIPQDVLTRLQKECILLAVSAANLNSYCVAMHCNLLRGLGLSPEEGDQIAVDHHYSTLTEADKGLLDFAVKLGAQYPDFSRDDVARLRTLGFTDEKILESEVVTALNNFANVLQMGLGFEPEFELPPAFQQNKMYLSPVIASPMSVGPLVQAAATAIEDADIGLVARAQAGDLDAFEVLVRRHTQLIYRALSAILGNPEDAKDAVQDALLSAFKHISGFRGRSKFSTWLVSIARNVAFQRLRGRKNDESLDESALDDDREFRPRQVRDWEDNPEQLHSHSEIQQLVERGIVALPPNYRMVVMLRDIEQLSTDEVARQLELSVPTVKVRLLRGRLMLREWLSPHFASATRGAAR
jgi:RNA polymerase sigma-70 factor, ECF subfamily